MTGFVKLYRSVTKTAIANNPEYFAAWIHLLCMATHTEHEQVVGRIVVNLTPGQLVFGRKKFSVETGVSENKVRAALDVMKQLKMITIKSHAKFSVISILNWDKYHGRSPANNQQTASIQPAPSQHPATNKKGEEGIKNGKNVLTSMSPQADDVTEAFDIFWSAGLRKQDRKKAAQIFKRIAGKDPIEFACMLRDDIEKRVRLGQSGIDLLHPSTYLNNERWKDEYHQPKQTGLVLSQGQDHILSPTQEW